MLKKLQFNNLVITNQNLIRQGRTQTINKLVHKIRKLKSQLEKKNSDKIRTRLLKTTEALTHLKKLKPIDIMKNVLLLKKSPSAVLTDGLSSPEETGNSLLALNKIINNLTKTFKETLQFSDVSLKWREELIEASKRRIKKNKTEMKKKRRKDVKEKKAFARKRMEWMRDNPVTATEQDLDLQADQKPIATVGKWKIEFTEKLENSAKQTQLKNHRKLQKESVDQIINIGSIEDVSLKEFEPEGTNKLENISPKMFENMQSVKKLYSNEMHQNERDQTSVQSEPIVTHVVDPFFLTETGENYLSTAVISQETSILINRKKPLTISETERTGANHSSGIHRCKNIYEDEEKYKKSLITEFPGKKTCFHNNKVNNIIQIQNKNESEQLDKLHPSWMAKKKIKSNITTFEGKKIKFANNSDED